MDLCERFYSTKIKRLLLTLALRQCDINNSQDKTSILQLSANLGLRTTTLNDTVSQINNLLLKNTTISLYPCKKGPKPNQPTISVKVDLTLQK